jgi:hypothetical protein
MGMASTDRPLLMLILPQRAPSVPVVMSYFLSPFLHLGFSHLPNNDAVRYDADLLLG